nr:transposase, MuDR, MULE transposase domain protein [Tanacetum cinerariifolium]
MTNLKECIGEVLNMAIKFDRHYAISIACRNVFPKAFHGFCCRHLLMNCDFKSKKLKAWYWETYKAYLVPNFEKSISYIREVRLEAYRILEDARFEKWSRACGPTNRYNYMTSNCAESINALTKIIRKVPIIMLMDYYRCLIQRRHFERRYNDKDEPLADELSR